MNSTYAERLIEAMGDKYTIHDLMAATGVSYQSCTKVMKGKSQHFDTLNHIAAAKMCGVNSDWLALGEGPKERGAAPQQAQASQPTASAGQLQMLFDQLPPNSNARETAYQVCFAALISAHHAIANPPTGGKAQAGQEEKQHAGRQ